MKKMLPALALMLSLAIIFCSCSARQNNSYSTPSTDANYSAPKIDMAMEAAMNPVTAGNRSNESVAMSKESGPLIPQNATRKIIKNGQLNVETKEFDQHLSDILAIIKANGGYVESQATYGSNTPEDRPSRRSSNIVTRIPAASLDAVMQEIDGICNTIYMGTSTDDVSEYYYDSQARLNSLTAQETRLLEIMNKAETVEEIISVEQALSNVRYQIESITGALKGIDDKVSYSSLTLEISEVTDYIPVTDTFADRLGAAADSSIKNLGAWFEMALFYVIADLPILLLNLAVFAVLILIIYRVGRFVSNKFGHGWKSKSKVKVAPQNGDETTPK